MITTKNRNRNLGRYMPKESHRRARLLIDVSEHWPKGTIVYDYGKFYCKLNGSCLEASLIYGNPAWEVLEPSDIPDDTAGID